MCGIFLILSKNKKPLNLIKCKKSLNELNKRGPDWSFYKIIDNIFFGQTVLSMTGDTNPKIKSHYSRNKRFLILFNGEIYNYKEIAKTNKIKIDKNTSDTEVLVNLFEKQKNHKIVDYLDGMYAYVVYDFLKKKIYISRDPQGEKSLFIYENQNFTIISSEINPIYSFINDKKIDYNILKTYFNSRHFIQFDRTIFKNLKNIEPGNFLEINTSNFKSKKISNFSINNYVNERDYRYLSKKKEIDLVNEFDFLLKKNLNEMIPAKRNFASIVSGGIDSTLVSFLLEKISVPRQLITLDHIGKDYISNNINLFQNYFKKKITCLPVNENTYRKYYLKSIQICQAPINSHDFVGKLMLAEKIHQKGCKAVFGGDGADELFGGYQTYTQNIKNYKKNLSDYTKLINFKYFKNNEKTFYYINQINKKWKNCLNTYSFIDTKDEVFRQAMMLIDTSVQLSSVGLRGCDLMAMNFSVEPRSIFLRKEIMKFGLNLPLKYKLFFDNKSKKFITKYLLKKVFLKYFKEKLIFPKQGFSGFPNEMIKHLSFKKKIKTEKKLKLKSIKNNLQNLSKAEKWKICNTEHFLINNLK
jgi:asparagine synthase (glutamine-hydrolysing)